MEDKIIQAIRMAVVADVGCSLTSEQCDRLLDMIASKDEKIVILTNALRRARDAANMVLEHQPLTLEIIPDYETVKHNPNSPWLQTE